jgi:uncharacterized membrane protein YuzA (DUF378 family)
MNNDSLYSEKHMYLVIMSVILFGGINLGIAGIFDFNPIEKINTFFDFENYPSRFIYMIIGVLSLYFLSKRDVFLPFLGDTVFPCGYLQEKTPTKANTQIKVRVPPYSTVLYWAAEDSVETDNRNEKSYAEAYMNYENSGVTKANKNGIAVLQFRTPQGYTVPSGKKLNPHVHYRYCKNSGMLSRVETVEL